MPSSPSIVEELRKREFNGDLCSDNIVNDTSSSDMIQNNQMYLDHRNNIRDDLHNNLYNFMDLDMFLHRFVDLLELYPEPLLVVDINMMVTFCNNRFISWLGFNQDDLKNTLFFKSPFFSQLNENRILQFATDAHELESQIPFDFVFENNIGERYFGLVNINPICNYYSEKIGFIFTVTDITQMKIEKEKFRQLDQFKRSFNENENIWLSLCDLSSNVIMWNKGAERISGYEKDEVCGNNDIWNWLKPDGNMDGGFSTTKGATRIDDTIISDDFETIIKRKDGKNRVISWNSKIFVDHHNNPSGTIAIGRDITHRKKSEEKIKYQNEELIRLNKVLEDKVKERTERIQVLLDQKNDFINQLGHDLKTPLTPLMVLLPLIRKEIQAESKQEMVDVLIRNTGYMKDLISKTIELAKLNSDMISLDIQPVCVSDEVESVKNDTMVLLRDTHISLMNHISKELIVDADSLRLREIISNLVANAVKYSKQEGGCIVVDAELKDDMVLISVRDDGIGMTEEQRAMIFDEFYKVDESRHNLNSSGLGLTIAKRLVEQHEGKIWVESDGPGKGSTFHFTLPKNTK